MIHDCYWSLTDKRIVTLEKCYVSGVLSSLCMKDIQIKYSILIGTDLIFPTSKFSMDCVVVDCAFSFGTFFLCIFCNHVLYYIPFTFNL